MRPDLSARGVASRLTTILLGISVCLQAGAQSGATADSGLLSAPPEIAQQLNASVDSSSIYHVELLVFADDYQSDRDSQQWPAPYSLQYREKLSRLYDAGHIANQLASLSFEIEQYKAAAQQPAEPTGDAAIEQAQQLNEPEDELLLPLLMVAHDRSQAEHLGQLHKTLGNRRRYRTLFYAGWYQSLGAKKYAPSIAIAGGRPYGDRYELEGSIKVSRGRYLHIDTDLWLIDWSRAAQEDSPWYQQAEERWYVSTAKLPADEHPAVSLLQQHLAQLQEGTASPSTALEELELDEFEAFDREVKQLRVRSARQVYRLNEKRRLKRDEIHYLDHPLFGAVVAISRWNPESSN